MRATFRKCILSASFCSFGAPASFPRIFFKYYKVNLEQECPFWEEDGQCMMRDCSVCECSPEEIPKPWLEEVGRGCVVWSGWGRVGLSGVEWGGWGICTHPPTHLRGVGCLLLWWECFMACRKRLREE